MRQGRLVEVCAIGLLLIAGGLAVRVVASGQFETWRASRMSDRELVRALGAPKPRFAVVYERAVRLERAGDLAPAAALYERAATINPASASAWVGWGRVAFEVGDWTRAGAVLQRAVGLFSENADAHFTYAAVLGGTLRSRAAQTELQAGLRINPERVAAWQTLGDTELELGRPEAAVTAYRRAIRQGLSTSGLHTALGHALLDAGQAAEALKELDVALRLDPSSVTARYYVGAALAGSPRPEDHTRALKELNRVVAFRGDVAGAWYQCARVLEIPKVE